MKRLFDIVVSIIALIVASPFFIVIGAIIFFNDLGPIFFVQKRVGRYGKLFSLYKFRSMRILKSFEKGSFEPGDTSRVTTIGKFLRKTKLDELPQLLNVLFGQMSLVGPRPEVEKWVKAYPERWEKILLVRPGITDNASIEFRNEEEILSGSEDPELTYKDIILPRKLELYEKYVSGHSFTNDIILIFKTVHSVIFN